MSKVNILYYTATGNTMSFVKKIDELTDLIGKVKAIGPETDDFDETEPYIAIVPTYLSGPDGIGPEVKESMTHALRDYIEFGDNQKHLIGVIGSGNLNFNQQFALTGKRYSKDFNVPLITTYELRGSERKALEVIKFIEEYNNTESV